MHTEGTGVGNVLASYFIETASESVICELIRTRSAQKGIRYTVLSLQNILVYMPLSLAYFVTACSGEKE